jgi:tRNA (cytosine38-C5)-methyltransferase
MIDYFGKVRFFTPMEIMRIMCFIDKFEFPNNVTVKSQYKLLGNSINVRVVYYLLELLLKY